MSETTLNRDELVELTGRLVSHPSENPPGNEAAVADAIVDRLDSSSIEFEVTVSEPLPGRPNVIARAGNPERGSVLLTGHTDVVPADADQWTGDPFELRHEEGRLIGRGTADMKGALAAKIVATEAYLRSTDRPGEVILGFVVDEEHGGQGTRAMVREGIDADYAIIGEPTNLGTCVAQKGVARYEIELSGRKAHSGTPDEGEDAIRAAGRLLAAVEAFDESVRKQRNHDLLAPETVTVTEIEGGTAPNVVADSVRLTVDWRFHPGREDTPESFDEQIRACVDDATIDADIDISIDRTVFARAAAVPEGHELVEAVVDAAADAGVESTPLGFNAATDARFLVHDAEIPTVLFGPGSIEDDAHTVDESIRTDELEDTAKTYANALRRLLG